MNKPIRQCIAALGLVAVLAPPAAFSDTEPAIPENLRNAPGQVREAILRYANTDLEEWHYVRTRVTEEGTIVDRHDPTLPGPEHWQLISINGQAPTSDELEEFEDDRADHSDDEEKARTDYVIDVIAPDSIVFKAQLEGAEQYAYELRSPDGKRKNTFQRLTGDMLIQPGDDGAWVRSVRVWNTETLRPVIGVRIDEIMTVFNFELHDGYMLPVAIKAEWRGEFLMLKDISRTVEVSLTDYRRADIAHHQSSGTSP